MERCVSWDIIALRLIITPMDWLEIGSCYYSVNTPCVNKSNHDRERTLAGLAVADWVPCRSR